MAGGWRISIEKTFFLFTLNIMRGGGFLDRLGFKKSRENQFRNAIGDKLMNDNARLLAKRANKGVYYGTRDPANPANINYMVGEFLKEKFPNNAAVGGRRKTRKGKSRKNRKGKSRKNRTH